MNKTFVKYCVSALLVLVTLMGCETYVDELWKINKEKEEALKENASRIAALEILCAEQNTNIKALSVMAEVLYNGDKIASVDPLIKDGEQIGYTISFERLPAVIIYDGEGGDGAVPKIGMKMDEGDGVYYWSLNGEWIVVDGHRIRCEGSDMDIPMLDIEDGRWKISYDGGKTWDMLGRTDGTDADKIFSSIIVYAHTVEFTLSDGTVLSLPKSPAASISFSVEGSETGVEARQRITIRYHLENVTENTIVTAMSDGNYKVAVHAESPTDGYLIITSPKYYQAGHVTILVSDGLGISFTKRISFYEREIYFHDGQEFWLAPQGGRLRIPMSLNFEYHIEIQDGAWISIDPESKAELRDETINCTIAPNYEFSERRAVLRIMADNNPEAPQSEILIVQHPAYFSMDRNRFVMENEASSFEIQISSSMELSASYSGWLDVDLKKISDDQYVLKGSAGKNYGGRRNAAVSVVHVKDMRELGSIEVIQLEEGAENPDDMIFKVRSAYYNDFLVKLPLNGHIDCYVDWGDGTPAERFTSYPVEHQYKDSTPKDYVVRISGTVTELRSEGAASVKEVIQWGRTGLNSMAGAFENNNLLDKLPEDNNNAFIDVNSFDSAFRNCTSLKRLPENLFTKCDNVGSFYGTFYGCTGLESIPEDLFRYCTQVGTFDGIFDKCMSLTSIPEDLFRYNTKVTSLRWIFNDCTGITRIPEDLLASCTELDDLANMFSNSSLESIPEGLFRNNTKITSLSAIFRETDVKEVPEKLLYNCKDLKNVEQMFYCCYQLEDVPVSLFDNNRKLLYFSHLLEGCYNLEGESPYSVLNGEKIHLYERENYQDYFFAPVNYNYVFGGCGNLDDYEQIPDRWK